MRLPENLLEHYAATHAEQIPMSGKAYLSCGRQVFYCYQYRRDMLARGEQHGNIIKEAGHGAHERPAGVQMITSTLVQPPLIFSM